MVRWQVPPSRRAVFVLVLTLVVVSVLVTWRVEWRLGGYLMAAALTLAGTARAVLPERYCLGLLVRGRRIDVLWNLTLAATIAALAFAVPGPA